jgi:hypothetical protein
MKRLTILGGTAFLAFTALAQQPAEPSDSAPPRPSPPHGFRVVRLAAYSEGDFLQSPSAAQDVGVEPFWVSSAGATGEARLILGRVDQFTVDYTGSYSYNPVYRSLNGAAHTLSLDFATDPSRRTFLAIGATGQTGLTSDALFDPSYILSVTQQAQSLSELSQGLSQETVEGTLNSAVELALSSGRTRSAGARLSLARSHSHRFTSRLDIGITREMRTHTAGQPPSALFPNVTVGQGRLSFVYGLAPRIRLTWGGGYSRSFSRTYLAEYASSGLGIEREVGRRSTVSARAAYVRRIGRSAAEFGDNSYSVAGSYGTTARRHSIGLTLRRSVGDVHGLGSHSTIGADGAWSWTSRTAKWRIGNSLSYEMLNESTLGTIRAWLCQATAVRTLGSFELMFTTMYLASASDVPGLRRTGVRVEFAWAPEARR